MATFSNPATCDLSADHDRTPWIDAARGLGILLVILGHAVDSFRIEGLFADTPAIDWSLYAIYSFHVPVLFFLSGLNVPVRLTGHRASFVARKVNAVGRPYLIWSILQTGLFIIVAGTHITATPVDLLLLPVQPVAQMWFLWSLLLFHLAAGILPRRSVAPIALIALTLSFFLDREAIAGRSLYYALFYAVGLLLAQHVPVRVGRGFALTAVAILLASIFWAGLLDGTTRYSFPALVPALGGIVAIWAICASRALGAACQGVLVWVGRRSLPLLVMHVMAAGAARIALLASGLDLPVEVTFSIVLTAAVAGPLVAAILMGRLGVSNMMGLGNGDPIRPYGGLAPVARGPIADQSIARRALLDGHPQPNRRADGA